MAPPDQGGGRWLAWQFLRRELANRFAGSLLGGAWALIHPIALLVVYGFVFSAVFRVRLPSGDGTPFLLFVAVVLWPWLAFNDALLRGSAAVSANGALVKKVLFRHELLVYAAVAASFVIHMAGYVLVLTVMSLMGYGVRWSGLPIAFVYLAALCVFATGAALFLAALHVFVRDIEQVLAHALALLFYLTPILYSAAMVPEWLRGLMSLNPLAQLLEPVRAAVLTGSPHVGLLDFGSICLVCGVVWVAGRWVFKRLAPHFEEAL